MAIYSAKGAVHNAATNVTTPGVWRRVKAIYSAKGAVHNAETNVTTPGVWRRVKAIYSANGAVHNATTNITTPGKWRLVYGGITPPTITTTALNPAWRGVAYNFTMKGATSNGSALGLKWSMKNAPPGYVINADTGAITGTTNAYGSYNIEITLHHSGFLSTTRTFPLNVLEKPSNVPKVIRGGYAYDGKWYGVYSFYAEVDGIYTITARCENASGAAGGDGPRLSQNFAMKAGEVFMCYSLATIPLRYLYWQANQSPDSGNTIEPPLYYESGGKRVRLGHLQGAIQNAPSGYDITWRLVSWTPPSFKY